MHGAPNGPALSRANRTRYCSTQGTGAADRVGWSAELERGRKILPKLRSYCLKPFQGYSRTTVRPMWQFRRCGIDKCFVWADEWLTRVVYHWGAVRQTSLPSNRHASFRLSRKPRRSDFVVIATHRLARPFTSTQRKGPFESWSRDPRAGRACRRKESLHRKWRRFRVRFHQPSRALDFLRSNLNSPAAYPALSAA